MAEYSVSLVLPAFNEAQNLTATVAAASEGISALTRNFEILIVDDGSTDATPQMAAELSRQHSTVRVITLPRNRGYGAALLAGFDGQFRFDQLPEFFGAIDPVDMVLGYRENRQDPWHRKLNSKVGNWLARTLLGVRVRDINCAYKLFRRELLQSLPLASDGAMINTELLALAARAGWSFRVRNADGSKPNRNRPHVSGILHRPPPRFRLLAAGET